MTMEELGNKVGVVKSTVMKWEKGAIKSMRKDKVSLLADALKVSPLWVIGLDDNEYKKTDVEEDFLVKETSTSELSKYFENNKSKLDDLNEDEQKKLIKLIDIYLD